MPTTVKRYPNRLGVRGWLGKGRGGLERYLYLAHRVTGLALMGFLMLHILVTSTRLFGHETWAWVMALTHHPIVKAMEFAVYVAFAFHAVNGVRLMVVELGYGIGIPEEPVYPYRSSVLKQRPWAIAAMIAAALLILLGGFELYQFD